MSRPRILDEDKRTLEEARAELGTSGTPCNFSTAYNLVSKGCHLPDGTRLPLEAVRVGGRWITSKQAIERFVVALTEAWSGRAPGAPTITTKQERSRRLEQADAELTAMRI